MKLENQVSSLEPSQKLRELGVKQESLFWWYQSNHSIIKSDVGKKFWYCVHKDNNLLRNKERISAFTVAELGELLPDMCIYAEKKDAGYWNIRYQNDGMSDYIIGGANEADARALMLIYLLENKLLKV